MKPPNQSDYITGMDWDGYREEKDSYNPHRVIIYTKPKNRDHYWFRNRLKTYHDRGYSIVVRNVDQSQVFHSKGETK